MDDGQNDIIDGEEVDSASLSDTNQATVLLNLEEMIKNNFDSLDKLNGELKKLREMFEDTFNNNPTYREHTEKVKEANKAKSSVRQQISKQPSVAQLADKIKSLRLDMKEREASLSDYLQEYQRMTGVNQIETRDGQVLEIINTSRLVKKSK